MCKPGIPGCVSIFEYLNERNYAVRVVAKSVPDAHRAAIDFGKISSSVSLRIFRSRCSIGQAVQTVDEFEDRYKLVQNHLATGAAWEGNMFETYGPEVEFIEAQNEQYVWTLLDTDDLLWVVAGYHFVNRIGYLVSSNPWSDSSEGYVVG